MNKSPPIPAAHLFQRGTEVFQPTFIEVIEVAVRPGGVNQRGDRINEKLNIQRLALLFCRGHGGNHTPREIHTGQRSGRSLKRLRRPENEHRSSRSSGRKWRTQGDDYRTFLGEFLACLLAPQVGMESRKVELQKRKAEEASIDAVACR